MKKIENINYQYDTELLIKMKNKKNPKIFNKEEIREIKLIKQNGNYNEKRIKNFLINYNNYNLPSPNIISQKNLLDNNSVLIRPNILSSAKQIQFEKEKTDLNEEYLQLLIQRLTQKNKNENVFIEKRKEDFHNCIEQLKIKKVKEKFNIESKNRKGQEEFNYFNNKNVNKEKKEEIKNYSHIKENKRKNCLLKSPMKPYSTKRKIWAGKNGIFKKEFQDNREFD